MLSGGEALGAGAAEIARVLGGLVDQPDFPWRADALAVLWLMGAKAHTLASALARSGHPERWQCGRCADVMTLLSVGAAYGLIVAVFQWGWGLSLLGLDDPVPIMSLVPMLLFAVLFGLSMDYEVFFLSAIREGYHDTSDPDRAVIAGLARTGRVMTAAAIIMSVVFISFASIDEILVKMVGVGLATAVTVDATVIRMVLASQWTCSPVVVTSKAKNAQHACSRAARSRTHASTPSSARNRNGTAPSGVRSRAIRAVANSRWYSARRSAAVSGAVDTSQTIGVSARGVCMQVLLKGAEVVASEPEPRVWTVVQVQEECGMKIGQVAHDAGVSIDTVRFYERRGVLPEPQRSHPGTASTRRPRRTESSWPRRCSVLGSPSPK